MFRTRQEIVEQTYTVFSMMETLCDYHKYGEKQGITTKVEYLKQANTILFSARKEDGRKMLLWIEVINPSIIRLTNRNSEVEVISKNDIGMRNSEFYSGVLNRITFYE